MAPRSAVVERRGALRDGRGVAGALSASEKWKLHRALVTLAALRIRRSAARALRGLVATRRPEDATTLAPDSASAGSAEER